MRANAQSATACALLKWMQGRDPRGRRLKKRTPEMKLRQKFQGAELHAQARLASVETELARERTWHLQAPSSLYSPARAHRQRPLGPPVAAGGHRSGPVAPAGPRGDRAGLLWGTGAVPARFQRRIPSSF